MGALWPSPWSGRLVLVSAIENMLTLIVQLVELLKEAVSLLRHILMVLNAETEKPDPLHDAKYAADRIGVVDRTLRRLTQKGELPVDSYVNGKRQFRASSIERCRRLYRGE